MRKFVLQIWDIYKPFRLTMLAVFGFIACAQGLGLLGPFLQGKVIDILTSGKPEGDARLLVIATFVVSILMGTVLAFHREKFELKNVDFKVRQHTNRITMQKLFGFSIAQHIGENSGIKQSIISRGQNSLNNLVYTMLYQVTPIFLQVVFLIGVLLYYCPMLGTVVFVGTAIYVGVVFKMNLRFKSEFRKAENMYNKDSKFQNEIMRNVELILSNAQQNRAKKEYDQSLQNVSDFVQDMWLRFNVYAILRNLIIPVTYFVVYMTGVHLFYMKWYTVGELVMFLMWSSIALMQVSNTGHLHRQLIQMYSSVRKYFDMFDIEPDVKEIDNPVKPEKFLGNIEFRNVTLYYKGRDVPEGTSIDPEDDEATDDSPTQEKKEIGPALSNVSFVIPAGQTVAIVGESGAGKSTIPYTILRAQDPQEGQVIIDGNDLRILDLTNFREKIGLVDQNIPLFDNTLRYNVLYSLNGSAADVTKERMMEIAEMSCIDRFLDRLEKGFDTLIGERGVKLSGGEQQRVGIARALAKNPDILIFDEATSHLDPNNEAMIRESIEQASKGRTTIIIAHRFSTIRGVDRVLVFDKGELVGDGTHETLAESCEQYQRLLEKQAF